MIGSKHPQQCKLPRWRVAVVQINCRYDLDDDRNRKQREIHDGITRTRNLLAKAITEVEAELRKKQHIPEAAHIVSLLETTRDQIRQKIGQLPQEGTRLANHANGFPQLKERILKSLEFCLKKGANIIVFPEHSVPAEFLGDISSFVKGMEVEQPLLIAAGNHTCPKGDHRAYKRAGISLKGWRSPRPRPVVPVFLKERNEHGRWLLVPKIAPSELEVEEGWKFRASIVGWEPLSFDGSHVAILSCSDFSQEHALCVQARERISSEPRKHLPLILVPACNPSFADYIKLFNDFRRMPQGRGVAYANAAALNGHEKYNHRVWGNSLLNGTWTDPSFFSFLENDEFNSIQDGNDGLKPNLKRPFRIPNLSEAVLIGDMTVPRSDGAAPVSWNFVSVAPIILRNEYPAYASFYSGYVHATIEEGKRCVIRRFWDGRAVDYEMGKASDDPAQACFHQKMTRWSNLRNANFDKFNEWNKKMMDYRAEVVVCGDGRERHCTPILREIIIGLYGICGNPELPKEFRQKVFDNMIKLQEEEKKFESTLDLSVKFPPVSSLVMSRSTIESGRHKLPLGLALVDWSAAILPPIQALVLEITKAQYFSGKEEQRTASLAQVFRLMEGSEQLESDLSFLLEGIAPLDSGERTTKKMHRVVYDPLPPDHDKNNSAPLTEDELVTSFLDWYEARFNKQPDIYAFVPAYSAKGKKLHSKPDKLEASRELYDVFSRRTQIRIAQNQRLLISHARIAAEKADREILKLLKCFSSGQVGFDSFHKMTCFALARMDVLAASLLKAADYISRTNQKHRQEAMYAGLRAAVLLMFGQTWTAWYQEKCRRWHETTPLRDQMPIFRQRLARAEKDILSLPQQAERILNLATEEEIDKDRLDDETRKLFELVVSVRVHLEWVDQFARWTADENGNKN